MQEEHKKADVNSEEFKTELEKTRAFADKVRDRMGCLENPIESENERIYVGLTTNKLTKGKRYCPCFMVEGETKEEKKAANNRICPCKPALQNEIPEIGKCYCGIFNTQEFIDNYVMIDKEEAVHHDNLSAEKLNLLFEKLKTAYLPIHQQHELEIKNLELEKLNQKIKDVAKQEMEKLKIGDKYMSDDDIDFGDFLDNITLDD